MIFFVTTQSHRYTMMPLLHEWAPETSNAIALTSYEQLAKQQILPAGCYIFCDIDRLNGPWKRVAYSLADRIRDKLGDRTVLNHPVHVKLRYQLLSELRKIGVNEFSVFSVGRDHCKCSYPVFLRQANDHRGSMSGLIHSDAELCHELQKAIENKISPNDLIVTEFSDTCSPDGWYRKYSAFIVGDCIIPRHVAFSRGWMVKLERKGNRDHMQEEQEYLQNNPHEEELRSIFRLARIDYGRIDYSMRNNRIQVWEINTNPMLIRTLSDYDEMYVPNERKFAQLFILAVLRLEEYEERVADAKVIDASDLIRWFEVKKFFFRLKKHAFCLVPGNIYAAFRYNKKCFDGCSG